MNAHETKATIERTLRGNGQSLSVLTVDQGVAIMLAFYRDQRVSDCSINSDGDMLLFQFGTHDWGDGESFEFDLSRQFNIDGDDDDADESIFQLSLTFKFTPTDELRALESGNKWCSVPRTEAVDYFERFIRDSNAYGAVTNLWPNEIDLRYECAG